MKIMNHDIMMNSDRHMVGGFNPSEQYESQLGRIFPYIHYIMESHKIPWFQTTKQL